MQQPPPVNSKTPRAISFSDSYSSDNRFSSFFTIEADQSYTLNMLELDATAPPRQFKNSDSYSDRYSSDNRFLSFFTIQAYESYTLNGYGTRCNSSPPSIQK